MARADAPLDAVYRRRAAPPGTARYWSCLFAPTAARAALLGVYALFAEWRALMSPTTEASVAATKLHWWREEMGRLERREPLHPIGRHLVALPRAAVVDFAPLAAAVEAAAAHAAGAPLAHGSEIDGFGNALWGAPLYVAACLSDAPHDPAALAACTAALGAGEYLARALSDYPMEARAGRIVLPVDDLLAAGVDNADLEAAEPPPRLRGVLATLEAQAVRCYATAQDLPAPDIAAQRGLLVLAALGARRLQAGRPPQAEDVRAADLLLAWRTARRAVRRARA